MLGEFIHGGKLSIVKSQAEPMAPDEVPFNFKSLQDAQGFFRYVMADPFARNDIIEITNLGFGSFFWPQNCRGIRLPVGHFFGTRGHGIRWHCFSIGRGSMMWLAK